jgi:hypothetical protein
MKLDRKSGSNQQTDALQLQVITPAPQALLHSKCYYQNYSSRNGGPVPIFPRNSHANISFMLRHNGESGYPPGDLKVTENIEKSVQLPFIPLHHIMTTPQRNRKRQQWSTR